MDELIQEWKQEDPDVPSLYGGSPLDILLGRVDESESEYGSLVSLEQENESSLTSRSNSSESIATMPPSLDFDDPSFVSSDWDNLSTPESLGRRSLTERRERAFSSPPKEDCVLDHPLLQMQTYERRSRSQKNRRSRAPTSDPFSEAGRASVIEPTVRQREPRENSDFLRVIVLEMNMRRMGKLDSKAVGKARIWLPPRKLVSGKSFTSSTSNGVPDRWVGIAVD